MPPPCPLWSSFEFLVKPFKKNYETPLYLAVLLIALLNPKFMGAKTCSDRCSLKIRLYMDEKE